MTTRTNVALLLTALSLTACHAGIYGGRYGGGYYGHSGFYSGGVSSSSYGRSGVVYNAPAVATRPVVQEVAGSDGTFGWRSGTTNPDNELRRLTESMVRAGCTVQTSNKNESRAQCNGVSTLVRIDSGDAYRLCVAGTDRNVCASTWTKIGG